VVTVWAGEPLLHPLGFTTAALSATGGISLMLAAPLMRGTAEAEEKQAAPEPAALASDGAGQEAVILSGVLDEPAAVLGGAPGELAAVTAGAPGRQAVIPCSAGDGEPAVPVGPAPSAPEAGLLVLAEVNSRPLLAGPIAYGLFRIRYRSRPSSPKPA
jgi:hypothetical protein